MNNNLNIPTRDSIKDSMSHILSKYDQNGMTPERAKERWEQYKNRNNQSVRSTDVDYSENIRAYYEKVNAPKFSQKGITSVQKQVNYEDARSIVWDIMMDKLGNKETNFSKEGNITEVIPELIRYFIGDSVSVYPLDKGVYLWGDTGSGKTFLIETMQEMVKELGLHSKSFLIYNTPQLTEDILLTSIFEPGKYLKKQSIFEDFGQEPSILKVFSNEIRPMHSIISRAYDNYKKDGQLIHFTSMLPPELLHDVTSGALQHIDRRTYERVREITTPVKLTGRSKRVI